MPPLQPLLLRALAGSFLLAAAGETSVSMLAVTKKQPTTSLASPSRAHRRVLAADRARHQPDAEAALPTPAPLGRKQPLIGANECDAHYVTTRRTMDASTATPGSPQDDASLSTLSSRPRPRRYRRKKHSMGRGFDAFLASKASKLARRRRDSSVQDCEKYTAEAAQRGYAAVRERKRQDFILECGDKAPPEPLTELVEMQNPEKPGTWVWSPRLAALLEMQEDHAPVPKHPINLPEYIVDCEDWEWITAIVRSVLLHNIDHFAHTYSAIEKGDKYFMGGRAETIFKTAVTVRPPKLYGPETLPRLPESDSESSEGETSFAATLKIS